MKHLMIALILVLCAACDVPEPSTTVTAGSCVVETYGNNVVYFPNCSGRRFAHALSSYLSTNPNTRVVSMAPESTQYGNHGMLIVFRTVQNNP